jgi:hypothetical protein
MEQTIKPKKVMTAEQLEILKARLLKARDAKIARTKGAVKGAVKEEAVKQIPITNVVNEIVKEMPFEKPLPKKRVPKPKPVEQPLEIPFEKELPKPKPHGMGWKYPADPIDIPKKKEKERFMKLVYYKEPSKATMKKLSKMQSSSSESESSSEDEAPVVRKPQTNDEDEYYKALAKRLYG